jgi:hypothetical protein
MFVGTGAQNLEGTALRWVHDPAPLSLAGLEDGLAVLVLVLPTFLHGGSVHPENTQKKTFPERPVANALVRRHIVVVLIVRRVKGTGDR